MIEIVHKATGAVVLRGLGADSEGAGHVLRAVALGDELDDLALPRR